MQGCLFKTARQSSWQKKKTLQQGTVKFTKWSFVLQSSVEREVHGAAGRRYAAAMLDCTNFDPGAARPGPTPIIPHFLILHERLMFLHIFLRR